MIGTITQIAVIAAIVLWGGILAIFAVIKIRTAIQQKKYGGNTAKTEGQEGVINTYHGSGLQ